MPRSRRRLCAALVALSILAPAASWAAAPAFTPTISGVLRRPDGRPAARVTLQAAAERQDFAAGRHFATTGSKALFTIRTDAGGHYQNELPTPDLAAGSDEARFHGFLLSPSGGGWAPLDLQITAQQPSATLDITLQRGDQVHGTVLAYPGGAPKPGAKVYAVIDDRLRSSAVVYEAAADRAGRYSIPVSLPPGEYLIGAAAKGYGFLAGDRRATGAPGEARDLTLRLIRDVRLRLHVLGTDGRPLRDHAVTVMVLGDSSNVLKPGAETGLDTHTDAAGEATYTFRYGDLGTGLANAYRTLSVWVEADDQTSPRVTVDAMHTTNVTLALRLHPAAP